MNYYDNEEKWLERGVDYDLFTCLDNNYQDLFMVADIAKVLAVYEGEHDVDDWRWVLELSDGRFVFLRGGCDYTGWDCQSSAYSWLAPSPEAAAEMEIAHSKGYEWRISSTVVRDTLLQQLSTGKAQTWREKTDKDLGITRTIGALR